MIPRKKYGQHFLEPSWADRLVEAIAPRAADRFLEIGPGPGALTLRLAPRVSEVTAVEIDAGMVADAGAAGPAERDARAGRRARVRSGEPRGRRPDPGGRKPSLQRLVADPVPAAGARTGRRAGCVDATLMLQREVAERIQARAGTRDYGVLAILVQLHADVRTLLGLPPGAFRPAPKVHSVGDPADVPRAGGQADGRAAVRVDGALDVHAAAEDAGECPGGVCRRAARCRRTTRWRARTSTPAGARRRCNSQNWRGLRRFSVRTTDVLCYSRADSNRPGRAVPAAAPVGLQPVAPAASRSKRPTSGVPRARPAL